MTDAPWLSRSSTREHPFHPKLLDGTVRLMDQLKKRLPDSLGMRIWGLVVVTTFGLNACSLLRPANRSTTYYFWDSNPQMNKAHAAVACTTVHALLTFNQLHSSGTPKDRREQATLLGESPLYASDAPPDPPCERAGHPVGPVTTPGPVDRVKNIKVASDGTVSFESDYAFAASAPPHQTRTYYTYPEYLVPAVSVQGPDR